MFDDQSYLRVLTSISAALTTLLGSVGIFVSLTVQRRVERLQDILEEFLDLSYHSDTNITGKMYKLIEKYQMHYLFPDTPGKLIVQYINFSILVVVILWAAILAAGSYSPVNIITFLYLIPIILGLSIMIFYRHLLKNAIYPFGNNLMSPLIPPPVFLRSVSYLSRYVNVSVKSILRQARLRLLIKNVGAEMAEVILKEEISFDDYFYYLLLSAEKETLFVAYGELEIDFGKESITGKPIPAAKNVSIPLGSIPTNRLIADSFEARLFIFPRGEKHPLEYVFTLQKHGEIITMSGDPEISVSYMNTYQIENNRLHIVGENAEIPYLRELSQHFVINKARFSCCEPFNASGMIECKEDIYID